MCSMASLSLEEWHRQGHSWPYHECAWMASSVVMVRPAVVGMWAGDHPRSAGGRAGLQPRLALSQEPMQPDERLLRSSDDVLISLRGGEVSACCLDLLPEANLLRLQDA